MAIRAILHIPGEEAILCDMDEMPKPTDNFITVHNPRRKDGKLIPTLEENASSLVFPWTRIAYIEFFEDTGQRENVVGFFRESDARRRSR
jgi:hypothetical protein